MQMGAENEGGRGVQILGVQIVQGCRGAGLMSAKRSKGAELRGAESRCAEGTGVQMDVEKEGEQRGAESADLRGAESSGVQRCRAHECKEVKGCRA